MKAVEISRNAFAFCRYSVAVLVWLGFLLKLKILIGFVFIILISSAILKIRKAPLIVLYSNFEKLLKLKVKKEIVNERAMRFAHIVGSVFSGIILILFFVWEFAGWYLTFILAILKTVSAIGMCPASKLYECAHSKTCCAFFKK